MAYGKRSSYSGGPNQGKKDFGGTQAKTSYTGGPNQNLKGTAPTRYTGDAADPQKKAIRK